MKYIKKFEMYENINFRQEMSKCAKQTVRNFYKPSRPKSKDEDGYDEIHDPIFLGYDDAYRLINHAKRDREAYNL